MNEKTSLLRLVALLALSIGVAACGSSSSDDDDGECGAVVDIGPSSIVNGRLEDGDCRVSDLDPGLSDPTFADEYRLTLAAPALLTITLRSSDVDAFLVVLDRTTSCSGGVCPNIGAITLGFDDDSGGGVNGTDSLLMINLPAGTYIVLANSFFPETGNYTLETSF